MDKINKRIISKQRQEIIELQERVKELETKIELNSGYPDKAKEMINKIEDKIAYLDESIEEVNKAKKAYQDKIKEVEDIKRKYEKIYKYFK